MNRRATTLTAGAVLLVLLALLANWTKVQYVELVPGPTFNTLGQSGGKELITISGGKTYTPTGQLRMLTVGEYDELHVIDVIRGWLDDNNAVVPREVIIPPGQSQQQISQAETDQFKQSQSSATTAALRHLGFPVQVIIDSVVAGKPAEGHLKPNDTVTAVDGNPVLSAPDLSGDIQAKPAGTDLTISYTRDGQAAQTVINSVAGTDGRPQIGVEVEQKQPSPYTISFTLDNVGGPSAGMMFALGIIDKLSPDDITGGRVIAGTGEIDDDGNIHPIGGIAQKMVAAYRAGARYFLAPADNCAEAAAHPVNGLTLIKVRSLQDALSQLQKVNSGQQPTLCTG
jgi:PDZ domain-containing protein